MVSRAPHAQPTRTTHCLAMMTRTFGKPNQNEDLNCTIFLSPSLPAAAPDPHALVGDLSAARGHFVGVVPTGTRRLRPFLQLSQRIDCGTSTCDYLRVPFDKDQTDAWAAVSAGRGDERRSDAPLLLADDDVAEALASSLPPAKAHALVGLYDRSRRIQYHSMQPQIRCGGFGRWWPR